MLQAGKRRIIMWQLFMSTLHDILTIRHLSWVCHPDLLVCDFIVTNLGSVTCWHQSLQVWTWIRACAGHPTNSILVLTTQFPGALVGGLFCKRHMSKVWRHTYVNLRRQRQQVTIVWREREKNSRFFSFNQSEN